MWKILLIGGLGGVLPSLLDKMEAWNSGEIQKWLETAPSIFIALLVACFPTLVYFMIGALVAAVYESQSLQKALLLGLGAPAFIIATIQEGQQQPKQIELQVGSAVPFEILSSAFAQEEPGSGEVQLKFEEGFGSKACSDCSVTFIGPDGQMIAKEILPPLEAPNLKVPDETQIIVFDGAEANPAELDLRQLDPSKTAADGSVTLDVGVNRSYWNDLARSFGAKTVQPYSFSIEADQQ